MSTTNLPIEIDFLPAECRQSHSRLKSQSQRLVVTGVLAVLVVAGTVTQFLRRQQVKAELTLIMPLYDTAVTQTDQLSKLQTELSSAQADAELFTYLRHPWPRTRILDALVVPLPNEIVLEQLQIDQENMAEKRSGPRASDATKITEEELKKLAPAVRDLRQLRQQCDRQQTVVTLSGVTTETAALHRYLGELAKMRLFSKTELASIETESDGREPQVRFSARVIVRPGYGQPGGPAAPEANNGPAAQASVANRSRAGKEGDRSVFSDDVLVAKMPEGAEKRTSPRPACERLQASLTGSVKP